MKGLLGEQNNTPISPIYVGDILIVLVCTTPKATASLCSWGILNVPHIMPLLDYV